MEKFWNHFNAKDFTKAQQTFEQLNSEEKTAILSELFQKSQYANKPHSISVLFRELHEGKIFADFHTAWFPPQDKCRPETLHSKVYQQFFQAPIRVVNAININNPKEIVSIGLHFLNEEQGAGFSKMVASAGSDEANARRKDSISTVADKTKSDIFIVETDDNLGTPF